MAQSLQTQFAARLARLAARTRSLFLRAPKRFSATIALGVFLCYFIVVSVHVIAAFEGRRWDIPAHVYAAPLELYAGASVTRDELVSSLQRTGYEQVAAIAAAGEFAVSSDRVTVWTRDFRHWDALEPSRQVAVQFDADRVAAVFDAHDDSLPLVRLEPVRLGSLFASHHEDRILVEPEAIPPLLVDALKAVEDRRFDRHHGLDFAAIVRAALVNFRHGEIRQGGSTLTQQLVKSYFLDGRRTYRRKFTEAVMAVALELRYTKDELLQAYINEIYLGQQGERAIHGFGLASEFYFAKPLSNLEPQEIALLVALVNGPSYYDPRRHPERARQRRDWVLQTLAEQDVIGADDADIAARLPLGISTGNATLSRYQPAYMDLVRRELAADYPLEDLETRGMRVFTSLDPRAQALAERDLAAGLAGLSAPDTATTAALEGAVVVAHYHTGEVVAMVGGREVEFDGFNRALAAKRPAGSLIKPVAYLAALQTGNYTLASTLDDEPVEVKLDNGDVWAPKNFGDTSHGEVPLIRALAESYNHATVRLGMEVGVDAVAGLLQALGLPERPPPHPSLLLGAVETTPFEIAEVYASLANEGFRIPLRAVRSVIDADGEPLRRYPLDLVPAADPAAVQQVNAALAQVIERGTARSARAELPTDLVAAGKTGTSGDFRDSWFAGFTNEYLAVVWVGRDDNMPTGFTGASGALRIWAPLIGGLPRNASYTPSVAQGLELAWLDYETGLSTYRGCGDAVLVPLPQDQKPPRLAGCGPGLKELGERVRGWLEGARDR